MTQPDLQPDPETREVAKVASRDEKEFGTLINR